MENNDLDLYASSPGTDVSINSSNSSKTNVELDLSDYASSPTNRTLKKQKKRRKNKYMYDQLYVKKQIYLKYLIEKI